MKHNNSGFTLVEVLAVAGIIGITLFGVASLSAYLDKSNGYSEAKISFTSLSGIVRETLRYQKTCAASLVGQNPNLTTAAVMAGTQEITMLLPGINGDNTPANDTLVAGATSQKINLSSVRLVNSVNLGGGKFYSEVQIGGFATGAGIQLVPLNSGGFYYTLATAAGGALISCDTLTDDPVTLCEEMGCTWNPAATPPCSCPAISLTCPPQQFLTGVDAAGAQVCTPLGAGPCPAGQYLRGVSIGANDCVPLPLTPLPPPPPPATPIDGVCGTANGTSMAAAPSTPAELCSAGTPSVIFGTGPWTWTCNGINGGLNASCSANPTAPPGCPLGSSSSGTGDPTPVAGCTCDAATPMWRPALNRCGIILAGPGPGCNSPGGTDANCTFNGQILRSAAASCDCPGMGGFLTNQNICRPDGMGGLRLVWECRQVGFPAMACQCD